MTTQIVITNLELWTYLGVPEEERNIEQRILTTVMLEVEGGKAGDTDDLEDTVDYEMLYQGIKELAKREHRTLERFAEEMIEVILKDSRVAQASATLRKFILPGTKEVSVMITRNR